MLAPTMTRPILTLTAETLLRAGCSRSESRRLIDKFLIREALEANGGNVCHAAKVLQAHRNTLLRDLKLLGMAHLPKLIRQRSQQLTLKFTVKKHTHTVPQASAEKSQYAQGYPQVGVRAVCAV